MEEGDLERTKWLIDNFKCEPSLYAKQMSLVNGHNNIVLWLEAMKTPLRNNVSLSTVHRRYDKHTGQFKWFGISEQYQYN